MGHFTRCVNSDAVTGLLNQKPEEEPCPRFTPLPRLQQEKPRTSQQLPYVWALASHSNLGSWLALSSLVLHCHDISDSGQLRFIFLMSPWVIWWFH